MISSLMKSKNNQLVFSFCLFNNGDYSCKKESRRESYNFEVRYLGGLVRNLKFLASNLTNVKAIIYLDNKLQSYYSTKYKAPITKLLNTSKCPVDLIFKPNAYRDPIGFIAERFRVLERKMKNTTVVIRDSDQPLTLGDLYQVQSFQRERKMDTMCYRQPGMSYCCMGGGLTTQSTGFKIPDPIKLLDKYLHTVQDAWGFDEYLLNQISDSLGHRYEMLLENHCGKWYYLNELIFDLPMH